MKDDDFLRGEGRGGKLQLQARGRDQGLSKGIYSRGKEDSPQGAGLQSVCRSLLSSGFSISILYLGFSSLLHTDTGLMQEGIGSPLCSCKRGDQSCLRDQQKNTEHSECSALMSQDVFTRSLPPLLKTHSAASGTYFCKLKCLSGFLQVCWWEPWMWSWTPALVWLPTGSCTSLQTPWCTGP